MIKMKPDDDDHRMYLKLKGWTRQDRTSNKIVTEYWQSPFLVGGYPKLVSLKYAIKLQTMRDKIEHEG